MFYMDYRGINYLIIEMAEKGKVLLGILMSNRKYHVNWKLVSIKKGARQIISSLTFKTNHCTQNGYIQYKVVPVFIVKLMLHQ